MQEKPLPCPRPLGVTLQHSACPRFLSRDTRGEPARPGWGPGVPAERPVQPLGSVPGSPRVARTQAGLGRPSAGSAPSTGWVCGVAAALLSSAVIPQLCSCLCFVFRRQEL